MKANEVGTMAGSRNENTGVKFGEGRRYTYEQEAGGVTLWRKSDRASIHLNAGEDASIFLAEIAGTNGTYTDDDYIAEYFDMYVSVIR
jgi:hypothetical protein